MEFIEFKSRILKLLREDEEFRYAVAGLIGLEEILKRLDRHEGVLEEILRRLNRHEEVIGELLKRLDRHEEVMEKMLKRLDRHEELIGEMLRRLNRHEELIGEMLKRLDRHEEELVKLREDMNKGFELVNRHISALGARWGLMAEEAFREGLRGILEKELGLKVEKWKTYDEKGEVFGYPSEVEVDIAIKDERLILIEISSHVKASDIYQFKRKVELYIEKTGRKPERLIIVTPYAEDKAVEASKKLGVEIYTKI